MRGTCGPFIHAPIKSYHIVDAKWEGEVLTNIIRPLDRGIIRTVLAYLVT